MAQAQGLLFQTPPSKKILGQAPWYLGWLLILVLGTCLILSFFLTNMVDFLKIATILSFLTAPFFALANYRLVTAYVPETARPSARLVGLSWLGIGYLFVFCGLYVWNLV